MAVLHKGKTNVDILINHKYHVQQLKGQSCGKEPQGETRKSVIVQRTMIRKIKCYT